MEKVSRDWRRPLMPLLHRAGRAYWRLFRPITLGVKLLLVRAGQVVLVRHTYGEGWHLVGGAVKRGETAAAAGRREAREEVGATLGALRLFGVFTHFDEYKSDHVVVFVCDDFQLAGARSPEIAETRAFDLTALPADVSPATRRRIAEYLNADWQATAGDW